MSSINTNNSAMAALATLRTISSDLESTQNRISTGYRVDTAGDNAAYWSIATTMRSDNKSLGAVNDALGLGKASVDIAYSAMDSAVKIVQDIQTKLVSAKADNVDKSKIQGEIKQLQGQLSSIVNSASFNSENYLSADKSDTAKLLKSIVGSFNRDSDGNVSIENLDVDTTDFVMVDSVAGATDAEFNSVSTTITAPSGTAAGASFTITFDNKTVSFTGDEDASGIASKLASTNFDNYLIVEDSTTAGKIYVINKTAGTSGTAASEADFTVSNSATTGAASFGTAAAVTTATDQTVATGLLNQQQVVGANASGVAIATTALTFDITDIDGAGNEASDDQIDALINVMDKVQSSMVDGAATLGSIQTRIGVQTDFLAGLMDSIDSGIGTLVDANMDEESTRLKALQTQQQLAIQSLSIANSNSQNILALFR